MFKLIIVPLIVTIFCHEIKSLPLDDYVNLPDPHYSYNLIRTYEFNTHKIYILNMTSQKWLNESIVVNPIWWHYLAITIPNQVTRPDVAFMVISNGATNDGIPTPQDEIMETSALFALNTGAVAAVLKDIPNEPSTFLNDPKRIPRREDQITAWTWSMFMKDPSNPFVLVRLAMVKASVRAMDTISEFVQSQTQKKIDKFVLNGESKRGWTTWLTTAVDKRVIGAIPMTMDLINMVDNLHAHYRALGNWSFAFANFYDEGITLSLDTPEFAQIVQIEDPLTYFDRYRDVKILMVNTGGDEFFLLATGQTVLTRRLPNVHHTFADIDLFSDYRGFFLTVYEKKRLPIITWSFPNNETHGIIVANVDIKHGLHPKNVQVQFAKTLDNKRRDFRFYTGNLDYPDLPVPIFHPVAWQVTWELTTHRNDTHLIYTAAMPKPASGWQAFLIEFQFESIERSSLIVNTEANIVPETYPYPDCQGVGCYGILV